MTRKQLAACILSLAFAGIGNAQGAATSQQPSAEYTQAELKQLTRSAHVPEQYRTLAAYYGKEQATYLQKAAEAKKEWQQRAHGASTAEGKYPRPADWARMAYEDYMSKANKSGTLEAKFSQMASQDAPVNAQ
jgi:hypothetical protein